MGTMIGLRREAAWQQAVQACRAMDIVGLLVNPPRAAWRNLETDHTRAVGFVRLSALLPHVAALAHCGGAGFMYAGLAAAKPAAVAPQAFDQATNAAVLVGSGAGVHVTWSSRSLAAGLNSLLTDNTYRLRAADVSHRLGDPEQNVARIADALLLGGPPAPNDQFGSLLPNGC